MICPICNNVNEKEQVVCSICGWNFAEDVTMHRILFSDIQIAEYQRRICEYNDDRLSSEQRDTEEENEREVLSYFKKRTDYLLSDPAFQRAKELNEERYTGGRDLERVFREQWGLVSIRRDGYRQEIYRRISNGTFEDLHVGDYFHVTMENGETVRLVLAEFGAKLERLYDIREQIVDNYAILIPAHCFAASESMDKRKKMILFSELSMSYEESYMHEEVLPHYAQMLQKALNYRILHREDEKELRLLTYTNLYGSTQYSMKGFALFEKEAEARYAALGIEGTKRCAYWLADESNDIMEGWESKYRTNENEWVSSLKKLGVRPYFYIG